MTAVRVSTTLANMEPNAIPQQYAIEARLFNGRPHTVIVDTPDEARAIARLNPGSSWYAL